MAESVPDGGTKTPKYFAPKNKNCPYCGQSFTSSSLGRHLDLWIRPNNPRAPDGIHDVDEIRRMRGNITRRQMTSKRPSTTSLRSVSTPVGTPATGQRKSTARKPTAKLVETHKSPSLPKDGEYVVDSKLNKWPFSPGFEAAGALNGIPQRTSDAPQTPEADSVQESTKRPGLQRQVSRQMLQKAQLDVKQRLTDTMDTARAAELALREVLSSWRAAKIQMDSSSMPFDFDPLALDFPALTLQCLQSPPTLFSSTQHPTSTSWSVQFPGQREFEALQAFFEEEFQQWKVSCAAATTASMEELVYPPKEGPFSNAREAVKKSEKQAEVLEQQVKEHLQSAYMVWDSLPEHRRNELWVLELARGVGRRQKETDTLKATQHKLQQEVASLKSQIDQLVRWQQPREFKLMAPSTIPIDSDLVNHILRVSVKGGRGGGVNMEDRDLDLGEVVSRSIERWKTVITTSRASSGGMGAQRPLDQTPNATPMATPTPLQQQQQQQQPPPPKMQIQHPPTPQAAHFQRRSTNTSATGMSDHGGSLTTGPSSVQSSEQDADGDADGDADVDAEMDAEGDADGDVDVDVDVSVDVDAEMDQDDSFAMLDTPPTKASHLQHRLTPLDVPRTRGPLQHQQRDDGQQQYMLQNGAPGVADATHLAMARSMPNLQAAMQSMHAGDMGLVMGVRADHMYMD